MLIIPAIDILGGRCARLTQGDYSQTKYYDIDPAHAARDFEQAGARRIHIVDLDAAVDGRQTNLKIIRKIRRAVSCRLQVGGGVRQDEDVDSLLEIGVDRIVVGTVFALHPELMHSWSSHYGDIFLGGVDAKDGNTYVRGWEQETRNTDVMLAKQASKYGAVGIVYTSISRDGMLEGPDIDRTNAVATVSSVPVILSGGVSGLPDLDMIKNNAHHNIVGVIVGKAVFEQKIDLKQAIEQYDDATDII